jgi:UDP-N-acetylmuramate--alanine ligase
MHNVSNALAALTLLVQLGVEPYDAAPVLERFSGARRRLEIKWGSPEMLVIDDYAHHPTEVLASIRALRQTGRRVTVIFQPHRFSRTRYFFKEFGRAFGEAHEVVLTDIYGAGESNEDNINVRCIYDQVLAAGHTNVHVIARNQILNYLLSRPRMQGIFAFIGAGDIGELADELANRFKNLTPA